MKQVLMLASVASMIDQFNLSNIALLQEMGYDIDVACNFKEGNTCSQEQVQKLKEKLKNIGVHCLQIDFARNVSHISKNMKALRQVAYLMKKKHYAFCHCHSPIGGVVARIAGHKTKTKIVYTAHGFHFYKGAPKKNWILYYPVEKFLSRWTDVLITINSEDYHRAKRFFHARKTYYVPGVGIDLKREELTEAQKEAKRKELGIPKNAFLITSVAEFTENKNQRTVVQALEQLHHPDIYYVMCGIGEKKAELERYVITHQLEKNILFVGFRRDIHEILQASDCFVLSSFREGLSVALMEAMAEGLPVVCSRIRGNTDLVENGAGGYLVEAGDALAYAQAFAKLYGWKKKYPRRLEKMKEVNQKNIQKCSCDNVNKIMREIYIKCRE